MEVQKKNVQKWANGSFPKYRKFIRYYNYLTCQKFKKLKTELQENALETYVRMDMAQFIDQYAYACDQ